MDRNILFNQLEELVLPLIEAYHNDLLVHDKNDIDGETLFLHFTGSTGAHIVFLPAANSDEYPPFGESVRYLFGYAGRYHILKQKVVMVNALRNCNRSDLIMYFNGKSLLKIDMDRAEKIVSEYYNHNVYLLGKNDYPLLLLVAAQNGFSACIFIREKRLPYKRL